MSDTSSIVDHNLLSLEQKVFITQTANVKNWYKYVKSAPIRELSTAEAIDKLKTFKVDNNYVKNNKDKFGEKMATKAEDAIEWGHISISEETDYPKYENKEQGDQRYFGYELDNQLVGIAMFRQDQENSDLIYIDSIVSHSGVGGASSALLEKIMNSIGSEDPIVRLSALLGTTSVYRRLGFFPKDTNRFNAENMGHYDSLFLNKTEEELEALSDNERHDYIRYGDMQLRPHSSELWQNRNGAWHYIPDGETYLANAS